MRELERDREGIESEEVRKEGERERLKGQEREGIESEEGRKEGERERVKGQEREKEAE